MKRLKIILIAFLCVVAVVVIWRAGFHLPQPGLTETPAQGEVAEEAQPDKPKESEKADVATQGKESPGAAEPNQPAEPNEPAESLEAINLKDVEMKNIIKMLGDWTGKAIVPTSDEVMKQKITIYSPKKVARRQALSLIYAALRTRGFVVEQTDSVIYLKPIKEAKLGMVQTIADDQPLAAIENKNQVVQKLFKVKNYSAAKFQEILLPLIGDYGYISADETTGNILVIDTVENLMRIKRTIDQLDIPEAEETVTEIFHIEQGDPAEIVQVLKLLLGDQTRSRQRRRGPRPQAAAQPAAKGKGGQGPKAATSVVIGASETPIVLVPMPKRKCIIARASAEDMKQIADWIAELDREEPVEAEYETIPVTYADVREVAGQIDKALQEMPGTELRPSVLVKPLSQSRQIMIFGRAELREMVKKLIEEIDIPPGQFEEKTFTLKHADPEQIKENIDNLYEDINANLMFWQRRWREGKSADMVRVIAFPTMQQVTVIASPENMRKIEKQIEDWDVPLDVEQVKPLIIELHNSDPIKMAELLTKLFTEEAAERGLPWWWFSREPEKRKKIVGPLYGQLTFEPVPDTKKIIVISKIPEAYAVVEEFVRELDRQEMAEVPKVITLKYADPEDLCERLNAMFNEPGTMVTIRLGKRGLSEYSMEESGDQKSSSDQDTTARGEYKPWWGTGYRGRTDEMPISNVIGRVRFIPDRRCKAVLVLAPPEFMENIEAMIRELDVPGKQVMIKAVIVEVDHRDLTSLGLQLASDPSAFGALDENAITALTALTHLATHGSLTLAPTAVLGAEGTGTLLGAATNVTALIDFLVKRVNAKILNQQTLWTKDNEEADFFKGQKVAFIKGSQTSTEARSITQDFEFQKVGMTLRVRPSITPEKNVDMIINVIISQLTSDLVNTQPVRTEMETTTNMIVQDAETLMLGGMLFQEDSQIERKLPLLGDVPLVGGLFRHNEIVKANTEMLVFITPYVIDEHTRSETIEELESSKEKLEAVRQQLGQWLQDNM